MRGGQPPQQPAGIGSSNASSTASASSVFAAAAAATFTSTSAASLVGRPSTEQEEESAVVVEHNPYALVLALIPMLTIFGNSMVILAVRKEKSLQTVTNYLIVSLASADLLVATCVMFFAVYFEWNSFVWDLGPTLCNLYIGADVACSTASILNLLAISIDRYIAISHPLAYCQIGTKNPRAYLSIALVWSVSIAVAVPLAFGANHISDENDCSFTNPVFMISSSVLSFFVPCLAMIALYAVIFRRLREREKARDMRKRGPALGVENALILNALMGGARMARQIAKSHLKDHLLLELSLQTSSFPSPSEEEEEEEEEEEDEPDPSDSEASTQPANKKCSYSKNSAAHKLSSSMAAEQNRRPTFCLMMNGAAGGMPFPLAPMNPLSLPRSPLMSTASNRAGADEQQAGGGKSRLSGRRNSRHRSSRNHRAAALVLRRCNTLPTAVLRRPPPLMQRIIGGGGFRGKEHPSATSEVPSKRGGGEEGGSSGRGDEGVDELRQTTLETGGYPLVVESLELLRDHHQMDDLEQGRPCSESVSQFSLRDSFWHGDDGSALSTQRSFGEGLQEMFPFIDKSCPNSSSSSSSSPSSSSKSSGSTSSSMDGDRKWSASAMTDPTASRRRRRTTHLLDAPPPRAHSSYCGWPEGIVAAAAAAEPPPISEVLGEEEEEEQKVPEEAREEEERLPPRTQVRRVLLPITLIQLASPEHVRSVQHHQHDQQQRAMFSDQNNNSQPQPAAGMEDGGTLSPKRRLSTSVRPRLSLVCPAACQSLPNLAESRLGTPLPREEAGENGGGVAGEAEAGFMAAAENYSTSARSTTAAGSNSEHRSASIGNRSVRIAATTAQTEPPTMSSPHAQQRNGSCPQQPSSAKSSSHQSPLQRIRNAFRRSLLAAMDEKRRPSRQLLKRATKQMRREQKATVTLAVVLAVFLCCWVPFFALHLSNALCLLSGGQQCVHFLAMFLSTWLGYLNSSLNPLIYTVFDKRFRKAFRELLACCLGPSGGGGRGAGGGLNRAVRARQR